MIPPKYIYDLLQRNNFTFFAGVPDSLLKDFCAYITDNAAPERNIIAANEGNAIGLVAGYYLSTGKVGVVYMQNSGLGNCVNPLTSLTDKLVYSIPVLLIIGWRGEPGKKDEPQHIKQGMITLEMLETLGIEYQVLPDSLVEAERAVQKAVEYLTINSQPYALVIKKDTFEPYKLKSSSLPCYSLSREDAIRIVTSLLDDDSVIVSTTGMISRELFELREKQGHGHEKDFLTVGSMGHSSSIALGIALHHPDKQVYCFDGDGAYIMHMGALSTIGKLRPANFKHIVFNNFSHDSVGGQPTNADVINIPLIAKNSGYHSVFSFESENEIKDVIEQVKTLKGPVLLEIKINKGARKDLGRPTKTTFENKNEFVKFLTGKK